MRILRRAASRVAGVPWRALAPVGSGLAVGTILGALYGYADSGPSGTFYPATLGPILITVLVVGGAGLVGVILAARARTRRWGHALLLATAGMVGGFPIGVVAGPHYEPPRTLPGTVTLDLVQPVATSLTGLATCTTEANGSQIDSVQARDLGLVGVDRLSVNVRVDDPGMGSVDVLVNGRFGYSGPIVVSGATADVAIGLGSFAAIPESGIRIGGQAGGATASGTVAWRCESSGGAGPTPSIPVEPVSIQGFFRLGGIIEVAESSATGACLHELDLGTNAIETVVAWVDGRQARLRLAPGRESATLSIDFGDGLAPETATAPAIVVEQTIPAAPEIVSGRQLDAAFDLRDGRLSVFVEWSCGDEGHPG